MKISTKIMNIVMGTAMIGLLGACSNQFSTPVEGLNKSASSGDTPDGPAPSEPINTPSDFSKLETRGVVDGGIYGGNWAFDLDKENNALLLNLPIPLPIIQDISVDLPDLPGAKIKTYKDSGGKLQVVVSIPLKYIVKGVTFLPSARTLPNGDALPGIPSGEAATLGMSLGSNQNVHLYVGVNAVGLYVESSYIPEYIGMTTPIKNEAGTRILGYFSIVPKKSTYKGGLFVAFPLPNDIARIIDEHLASIIQ